MGVKYRGHSSFLKVFFSQSGPSKESGYDSSIDYIFNQKLMTLNGS